LLAHDPSPSTLQQPTKHRRRAAPSTTAAAAAVPLSSSAPSPEIIALFESALGEFAHGPSPLKGARATADTRRSGSRAPTVSALQQEVGAALEALGFRLHREVDDGGVFQYDFVVDPLSLPATAASGATAAPLAAAVRRRGRSKKAIEGEGEREQGTPAEEQRGGLLPVVVEVDGSPHFFVNDLQQPLGDTRFKRRLVRAQVHE
jgi:hypothetical protein